jgi:hypothetical protein
MRMPADSLLNRAGAVQIQWSDFFGLTNCKAISLKITCATI